MKKRTLNLQLFAEPTPPTEPTVEPVVEPTPQEPPAEPPTEPTVDDKKYSDKDVDDIVSKKFAKWKADEEKKVESAKAEAAKLAKMDADQKKQYEIEKLQKENEDLKKTAMRVELGKTATGLLSEHEINATEDILDFVVGDDADVTKANIDKFVKIVEAQLKKAEIDRATGKTPSVITGNKDVLSEIEKRTAKYIGGK